MFNEQAYIQLREFLLQFKNHWGADVINQFVAEIDDYFIPFLKELNSNRYADNTPERVTEYWHTRITDVKGLFIKIKTETEAMASEIDAITTGYMKGDTFIPYTYKSSEILRLLSERIADLEEMRKPKTEKKTGKDKKSYSLKQVCVAYHFMGGITEKNGAKLLKLHTRFNSVPKLLQKVVTKASDLTKLSENKTTDTKHLNDLKAAERLISGKKNVDALKRITYTIEQFRTNYDKHY